MYEALAGIPLHYGVEVTNSVVVCTMRVDGTRAELGGTIRVDGEVVDEPRVILEILRAQQRLGCNAALIVVVSPGTHARITEFFDALYQDWPLEYHAGNALHTRDAIAAGCGCGETVEMGDPLELMGTVTSSRYWGRNVLSNERDFRARRTPGAVLARKLDELLSQVPTPIDTTGATEHLLRAVRTFGAPPMTQRATILRALEIAAFRDGFISWASSTSPPPSDFTLVPSHSSGPDEFRIRDAISTVLDLCRWMPEGAAAAPIGTAAYLAWYSGNGLQARVLTTQALEEDPSYRLALLVESALTGMVAPPWVTPEGARLVS